MQLFTPIHGALIVLVGSFYTIPPICGETLIEESFQQDPKWKTIGMTGDEASSFGWNAATEAIAAPSQTAGDGTFVRRNGWDAYLKPLPKPITDTTGFELKGDIVMSSDEPYARIYLGLFDENNESAEVRNALYIERSRNPTQHYLKIYAVDQSGAEKVESKFFGLGKASSGQTVEISYDPASRTLSWTVDGKAAEGFILPEGFHFSLNACGVSNSRWSNASTAYVASGQVDNITLKITP